MHTMINALCFRELKHGVLSGRYNYASEHAVEVKRPRFLRCSGVRKIDLVRAASSFLSWAKG